MESETPYSLDRSATRWKGLYVKPPRFKYEGVGVKGTPYEPTKDLPWPPQPVHPQGLVRIPYNTRPRRLSGLLDHCEAAGCNQNGHLVTPLCSVAASLSDPFLTPFLPSFLPSLSRWLLFWQCGLRQTYRVQLAGAFAMLIEEDRRKKEARRRPRRPKRPKVLGPHVHPHERQFEYTKGGWVVPEAFTRINRDHTEYLTGGTYMPFPYRMPGVTEDDLRRP